MICKYIIWGKMKIPNVVLEHWRKIILYRTNNYVYLPLLEFVFIIKYGKRKYIWNLWQLLWNKVPIWCERIIEYFVSFVSIKFVDTAIFLVVYCNFLNNSELAYNYFTICRKYWMYVFCVHYFCVHFLFAAAKNYCYT